MDSPFSSKFKEKSNSVYSTPLDGFFRSSEMQASNNFNRFNAKTVINSINDSVNNDRSNFYKKDYDDRKDSPLRGVFTQLNHSNNTIMDTVYVLR